MKWYEKTLKRYKKEIATSAVIFTVFMCTTLIWGYFSGESFTWTKYEPLSYPTIGSVGFYSALAFRTLGALLFSGGFYLFLYKISGSRREFNRNKKDVWKLVTLTTLGLTIVVFWIINSVLSILFNIVMFILYLLPSAIVTLLLVGLGYLIFKKYLQDKIEYSIMDRP